MLRAVCVLTLVPALVFAQGPLPTDWEALKSIPAGERMRVEAVGRDTLKGRLVRVSDDALTLSSGEVPRKDVVRLWRMEKGRRPRAAAIGAAVGAGAGVALGLYLYYGAGDFVSSVVPSMAAIGGGIGAGIGALAGGTRRAVLVYARPPAARP